MVVCGSPGKEEDDKPHGTLSVAKVNTPAVLLVPWDSVLQREAGSTAMTPQSWLHFLTREKKFLHHIKQHNPLLENEA